MSLPLENKSKVYLGDLYEKCKDPKQGVTKDQLKIRLNFLKNNNIIDSKCSLNDFINICKLNTIPARCILPLKSSNDDWDYIVHSTVGLNKNILTKIIWEDQALLPSEYNKDTWIKIMQNSNLDSKLKKIISQFNLNTNLIEEFITNPELRTIYDHKEVKEKLWEEQIMFPAVYTSYIFKDLEYRGRYWNYMDGIVFIFDSQVLKDLPVVVCKSVNYGSCLYQELKEGFFSISGDINTKQVRNMINNNIKKNLDRIKTKIKELQEELIKEKDNPEAVDEIQGEIEWYQKGDDPSIYRLTNEVLFDFLPINYLKAIIVNEEDNVNWVYEVVKPLGIPVYYFNEENMSYETIFFKENLGEKMKM